VLYKFHLPVAAGAYGASGLLVVAAPAIVDVLYDSRYRDAGWMLQILGLALVGNSARVHAAGLLAQGLSRIHFVQSLVGLVTVLIAVPAGYALGGVPGAIWGVVVRNLSALPVMLFFSCRHGMIDWKREGLTLPFFAVGAVAGYVLTALLSSLA
jgi:hypothetical protein